MATLLSSPLSPPPKFHLFQQPSSPKHYAHQDLPADFDKSFGSSMSISDSLDGHTSQAFSTQAFPTQAFPTQAFPTQALPTQPFLFNTASLGFATTNQQHQHSSSSFFHNASTEPSKQQLRPARISPPPTNTLGAAMGTTLNARSPALAPKMSSPKDMDISPAPLASATMHNLHPSPSDALPNLINSIHVTTSSNSSPATSLNDRLHPLLGGSSRPPQVVTERKSSLQLAHSMSSRLFGAEIALNSHRLFAGDQELLSSPDKEPPPKRRPNSLPTRQSEANERISQLSSALMPVATAKHRPALSATFDSRGSSFDAAPSSSRASSVSSNPLSDSGLPLGKLSSKRSSRAGSAESFFEDLEDELGARQTILHDSDSNKDGLWQAQNDDDQDDDINPSPSPSMGSVSGAIAGYFYDPLSPDKLATRLGMAAPLDRPNLLAAMSSTAASPSVSSPPASSPCTRMPPPKRTTSLGTRVFQRARTDAAVPRAVSGTAAASGSSAFSSSFACGSASGVGALRTTLGKRANPYVKRPSLVNDNASIKSAYPILGVRDQTTRTARPTAPAPRRCLSAFDHSSFLGGGGPSASSKLNVSSNMNSPTSPDRRRTHLSSHSQVTDADGSPIAPGMRARLPPPNLLRRGSKDDSSPLAYGTGIKRSASRGSESMNDDMALNDPCFLQSQSPASAESLPGFGASEKEGKILPCFNVKEDGLMRITAQTMTDLLVGKYTNAIQSYQVIDCRFGYEYEGGHIPGAINLSTVEKVVDHFFSPNPRRLPPRSQSGKADQYGNRLKQVLVFHCEFSCKRAPTMALALRQADRGLAHDYPNCHFPEIYILQGGYCHFWKNYPRLCEPQEYVCMDDPRFLAKRSTELNGFRKQFSRHRSFAYGEGKRQSSQSRGLDAQQRQSIQEEEMQESPCPRLTASKLSSASVVGGGGRGGDTSFGSVGDSSFEDGIGDSPCAAAGSRILQPEMMGSLLGARRPLLRAGTTGNILPRYLS
ncbi:hypothetical protein NDA18_002148 [Ustilago nuda]|nr:hypothetical protein NDA18_002148 [Ustilago nuda]